MQSRKKHVHEFKSGTLPNLNTFQNLFISVISEAVQFLNVDLCKVKFSGMQKYGHIYEHGHKNNWRLFTVYDQISHFIFECSNILTSFRIWAFRKRTCVIKMWKLPNSIIFWNLTNLQIQTFLWLPTNLDPIFFWTWAFLNLKSFHRGNNKYDQQTIWLQK